MEQEPQKSEEVVEGGQEEENLPIRRSTRRRVPVTIAVKEVKKLGKSTGNSLLDMMNSLDDEDDDDSSEYSEQSESSSSSSSSSEEDGQDGQEKNGSKRAAKQAKISRKEEERQESNNQSQPTKKDQEEQQHIQTLPANENASAQDALPQGPNNHPEPFVYSLPTKLPNFLINKLITKYK